MKAQTGDKVLVLTEDEKIEGILMPNEETDFLVVKLDSGYNIGIYQSKVKKISVLESYKKTEDQKSHAIKTDPKKPNITILHTGGTIASKVDYRTGGVVARFSPEEILEMFPQLKEIANIKSKLVANMFSEDIRFRHYTVMCNAIGEEIKSGIDGIILTHGTDTMGYSAAALSFAFENIGIPLILVGSQRSSDRGSSDAQMNLICAAKFISNTDFAGVAICMHENENDDNCIVLPGCKTRKMHTSRRDAFNAVNEMPIATVSYETNKIEFIKKNYPKKNKVSKVIIRSNFEEKIGLIKAHPNMFPEQFKFFKGYKGLVIEGTGLGQAPVGVPNELSKINGKNLDAIKKLIKDGCIVVMTSQCIYGRVHMHVYSDAIDMVNAGVIPGEDMLSETAFVKLAWLLGNFNHEDAKKMISQNLRGEINIRHRIDDFKDEFLK